MTLLHIENAYVYYGGICALRGLSLEVEQGEIVTLIGANGAGKTTTLNTISGLLRPAAGTVSLDRERIDRLKPHEIVRRGISHCPEGRKVFQRMSVFENLEIGAFGRNGGGKPVKDSLERVFTLFPRLKDRQKQAAGTLSGGEQQMLAMGRALMAEPRILLLDEPSMGLAPIVVDNIFEMIHEVNSQGTTVLLVEQNALMALSVAHRGYVLQTGEIILKDTGPELLRSDLIRQAYLGED